MPKLSIKESQEIMDFYYRLTGQKITTIPELNRVKTVVKEFIKDQIKIHA